MACQCIRMARKAPETEILFGGTDGDNNDSEMDGWVNPCASD